MQNGMLPDTLFKLGGFMSFSDNNCYLEQNQLPPPLLEFLLVCSQLRAPLESFWCSLVIVKIHEEGNLSLMVSCEFILKAPFTSEVQEIFRLGQRSSSKEIVHLQVAMDCTTIRPLC